MDEDNTATVSYTEYGTAEYDLLYYSRLWPLQYLDAALEVLYLGHRCRRLSLR
jgi:hypothetical protein